MSIRSLLHLLAPCAAALGLTATVLAAPAYDTGWSFLDNGQIRLGVKTNSGACIGYLSLSGTNRNLLDHFDQGRFVQQSFYGNADGTLWAAKPWRWNPVQGGDYKGGPARLLALNTTSTNLYAKTMGRHWSGCVDLPEVTFEEWINLTGRLAQVHYRMTYSGTVRHTTHAHEVPAVFVPPDLKTLVLYDGDQPWKGAPLSRSVPGWPNEGRRMTEHWAAYVDATDFGVGAYVPVANQLTCYRFGDGRPEHGSCSYFAPLVHFPVTPGLVYDYTVYLALGKPAEIRETFRQVARANAETLKR
jgi:hypothetical protein